MTNSVIVLTIRYKVMFKVQVLLIGVVLRLLASSSLDMDPHYGPCALNQRPFCSARRQRSRNP